MRTTTLALLLAVLVSACASRQPAPPTRLDRPSPSPASLIGRFADCVGILGPTRELPAASIEVLETRRLGGRIPLPSEGLVRDGYEHWLQIEEGTSWVYIVQVGGFAGTVTVFGPFAQEDGCLAFPPPDHAPWFWDLVSTRDSARRRTSGSSPAARSGPARSAAGRS